MTIQEKLQSNVKQIQVICDYLIKECEHDSHLAQRVLLESKTIDNMYQYILTAVKHKFDKQIINGGVMVQDEDVFNLAIHYFIEDDETLKKEYPNIVTKAEVKANTVPAKAVETTSNEEAYEKWLEKAKANNFKPDNKPKKADEQLSLFDFNDEEELEEEPEEDEENEYDGDEE